MNENEINEEESPKDKEKNMNFNLYRDRFIWRL
jgi:hypothetical protein